MAIGDAGQREAEPEVPLVDSTMRRIFAVAAFRAVDMCSAAGP